MKPFILHIQVPSGSVLVGGSAGSAQGFSVTHARDGVGRAIIPATALRGAMREAFEAVLRGSGIPACCGGNGRLPVGWKPPTDAEQVMQADVKASAEGHDCKVAMGTRCRACRLFGTRRPRIDAGKESSFSALVLSDARKQERTEWTSRPGVARTRKARTAENFRLFFRETTSPGRQSYRARLWLRDPEALSDLEVAIQATSHVGADRSGGLARVDMHLEAVAESDAPPPPDLPDGDTLRLRVTLGSGAVFGTAVTGGQVEDTRLEIPGAALRGCIGFALAASLSDPDADDGFQALIDPKGARFGFLCPVEPSPGKNGGMDEAAPLPITAAACKHGGWTHGLFDTLLDLIAAALVRGPDEAVRTFKHMLSECPRCRAPLRDIPGWRRHAGDPSVGMVTRVSIDRNNSAAQDGALFTRRLLTAGNVFEGEISHIPSTSRERLTQALNAPLFIGRGAAHGWGELARVEVLEPVPRAPISERRRGFRQALSAHLKTVGLDPAVAGRLVSITLLSPLFPDVGGTIGTTVATPSLAGLSQTGPVGSSGGASSPLEPFDSKADPPPAPLKKGGRPARHLRQSLAGEGPGRTAVRDGASARLERPLATPSDVGTETQTEPSAGPTNGPPSDVEALVEIIAKCGGTLLLKLRRFVREGGWDQRKGTLFATWAVVAGSIFVLEFPSEADLEQAMPQLEALEADGLGARREQGYGRLRLWDPFALKRGDPPSRVPSEDDRAWDTKPTEQEDESMDTELYNALKPLRARLVLAAEGAMQEIFRDVGARGPSLQKTQLNHLIGVAREAVCIEEIENYLRYQGGRRASGWDLGMVKKVTEAVRGILDDAKGTISADEQDLLGLEAWRLFANYLTRAYTYEDARRRENQREQAGPHR